jgi:hypothetical protein
MAIERNGVRAFYSERPRLGHKAITLLCPSTHPTHDSFTFELAPCASYEGHTAYTLQLPKEARVEEGYVQKRCANLGSG